MWVDNWSKSVQIIRIYWIINFIKDRPHFIRYKNYVFPKFFDKTQKILGKNTHFLEIRHKNKKYEHVFSSYFCRSARSGALLFGCHTHDLTLKLSIFLIVFWLNSRKECSQLTFTLQFCSFVLTHDASQV